jgi:hypothetical protein
MTARGQGFAGSFSPGLPGWSRGGPTAHAGPAKDIHLHVAANGTKGGAQRRVGFLYFGGFPGRSQP